MRELFTMWRNTRMIVLTAISAAAYVALLVPFKPFVIIPGFTEIRPAAAIPVVLSLLFGPAAAWGAGFGNLIADALGGMLGPGSIPGFFGNFIYGFLPYTLWRAYKGHTNPVRSGIKGWFYLILILAFSSLAIGSVIGWGVDLLKLVPFKVLSVIIAVNNFLVSAIIATVLLALLYDRVSKWGLLYFQILDEESLEFSEEETGEQPSVDQKRSKRRYIGAACVVFGVLQAFLTGMLVPPADVTLTMAPGLLALLIGILLL